MINTLIKAFTFVFISSIVSARPDRAGVCAATQQKEIENGMGGSNTSLGYIIQVKNTSYSPGESMDISILGPESFKGLLLYIMDKNKNRYAGWGQLPNGIQFLDDQCKDLGPPGSTISHSNPSKKQNFTMSWQAPKEGEGPLTIAGVVAMDEKKWQILKPQSLQGPGTAATPTKARGPAAPGETGSTYSGATGISEQGIAIFIFLLSLSTLF